MFFPYIYIRMPTVDYPWWSNHGHPLRQVQLCRPFEDSFKPFEKAKCQLFLPHILRPYAAMTQDGHMGSWTNCIASLEAITQHLTNGFIMGSKWLRLLYNTCNHVQQSLRWAHPHCFSRSSGSCSSSSTAFITAPRPRGSATHLISGRWRPSTKLALRTHSLNHLEGVAVYPGNNTWKYCESIVNASK